MRLPIILSLAFALSACSGAVIPQRPQAAPLPKDRPATAIPQRATPVDTRGLNAVLGKNIADLKRMFGEPRIDVVEVYGRKLQFSGKACILDAYLYPDGASSAEVVTHVDARRSDGAAVDKAACIDALMRR
jgi:hypothetical protein